ncbi:hypothetical protein [uncultured Dokdonia sp.]|uniref:hypothetical protein n=1 Tax=uncultured Dokdonia sp. TaxID=575653 RepID=UPI002610FCD5|nr:hypothetical protein [uncultured Dokdonia sp.]
MKGIFLTVFILFCGASLHSQNYDFPPNAQPGKCYERCFEYDKKFTWKEISCDTLALRAEKSKTKEDIIKARQAKIKLTKYQEKLKDLGYKVQITGKLNNQTIKAHHKYLKRQKKKKRKKRRL